MSHLKRYTLPLMLCFSMILLSACGGSSDSDSGSTSMPSDDTQSCANTTATCSLGEEWQASQCACTKIGLKLGGTQ